MDAISGLQRERRIIIGGHCCMDIGTVVSEEGTTENKSIQLSLNNSPPLQRQAHRSHPHQKLRQETCASNRLFIALSPNEELIYYPAKSTRIIISTPRPLTPPPAPTSLPSPRRLRLNIPQHKQIPIHLKNIHLDLPPRQPFLPPLQLPRMIDQHPRHRNPIRRRQQRLQLLAPPPPYSSPGKGISSLSEFFPESRRKR